MANKKISELQEANQITKDDVIVVVSNGSTSKTPISSLVNFFLPVGITIEIEDVNFDPNVIYGGSWVREKGTVSVGVDEDDSDFAKVGIEGGAKTHKMTLDELVEHDHVIDGAGNVEWALGDITFQANMGGANTGRSKRTKTTGGSKPFSILQPYRTKYKWRRIE